MQWFNVDLDFARHFSELWSSIHHFIFLELYDALPVWKLDFLIIND